MRDSISIKGKETINNTILGNFFRKIPLNVLIEHL